MAFSDREFDVENNPQEADKITEDQNMERQADELLYETAENIAGYAESEADLAPAEENASVDSDEELLSVSGAADAALPAHRELSREEMEHFRGLMEAVLFLSNDPLSVTALARKCNLDRTNARILADSLVDDYAERDGGILLKEVSGGYQFLSSERYSHSIQSIFNEKKREKLSRSALETLAIISYKQPITLPEIDEVRGANSRGMVAQLLARRLIKSQGYRQVPGRPTLYVTSRQFLNHFALNSLADLPPLEDVKELHFDDL